MTWPVQKLDVINDALVSAGIDEVFVAADGSDNWNAASRAYEIALEFMLDNHNWAAVTKIQTLQPLTTPPEDRQFDTAYPKPPDCVHLIWMRLDDAPVLYKIVGNHLEVRAISGSSLYYPAPSGTTPGVVQIQYVSSDPGGDQSPTTDRMARTFITALMFFTLSGIYRSLMYDVQEAAAMWKIGVGVLQEAKTRADQETPKRAMWNSRIYVARRVRRPWPQLPSGWGGTGSPG
jgi:hypothetical protein